MHINKCACNLDNSEEITWQVCKQARKQEST